jgi:hypothetical protein
MPEGGKIFLKKIDKEVPAAKQLASNLDTIISEVRRYYARKLLSPPQNLITPL